jgi:hypothetical protein
MKRLGAVLLLCAAPLAGGAETADVTLYFTPALGGAPEEREFFDANLPGEIHGPYYRVVESEEEADFLVVMSIDKREEPEQHARFTLGLMTAGDSNPLLELSWDYKRVEEMYAWDVGSILAPPPTRAAPAAPVVVAAPAAQRKARLYVGARGGAALTGHFFQTTPAYNAGQSSGLSAEGGVAVELRLFRFLSFQAEGNALYESFHAPRMTAEGNSRTRSTDTFSSLFFLFPVMAKAPLELGGVTLSIYGGAYYVLAPWGAERTAGATGETERVAGQANPFGIVVGTDVSFRAGPGELVADVRYGNNLGTTVLGDGVDSQYMWNKINVSVGYKFGFGSR